MARQSHSFSVEDAEAYGIECAILINHFKFWIEQNQAMGRNFHDGRTWMYQTQQEITAVYSYWSEDIVFKLIKKLVDEEVLIKGNYNKTSFDRTTWYAFKNEKMFTKPSNDGMPDKSHTVKPRNGNRQTTEPIPDTNPDTDLDDDDTRGQKQDLKEEKSVQGNVNYIDAKGNSQTITTSEIFRQLIRSPYPTDVIRQAIDRIRKIRSPITDFMHYLKSICDSIVMQNKKSEEPIKKKEKKEPEFKLSEWLFEWQEFEKMLKSGKVTLEFVTETMKNNGVFNEWTKWREELQDA